MKLLLEVNDIVKKFGKTIAVNELSFNIYEGEVYALVGPNGAGKTTTLRITIGLLKSDKGCVKIRNINVHKDRVNVLKYMTFMPDVPVIYGGITIREYLIFITSIRNIDRSRAERLINDYCEKFKLKQYLDTRLSRLFQEEIYRKFSL